MNLKYYALAFSSICALTSAMPMSSFAAAQDAAQPAADATANASVEPVEVVVTGSRVIRTGNSSPTPTTVVTTDQLLNLQPTTIASALQNLPVFQGSLGQNTGTGGSVGGPNGAASVVNLRNLGLYRTLVLFDGKRLQPTANTGLVTIDFVPQMLLQRVDVVTGGVSAVYGSEAISGVVNFVTDRKFNGVKIEAQGGVSEYGDDPISSVGIAAGTRLFKDRGHIEGSLEYYNDPGIMSLSKRNLGQNWALEGANVGSASVAGSAGNPYALYSNVGLSTTSFGGLIRTGPLAGLNFSSDGVLSPFVHGGATGTTGFETGGDGGYYYNSSLKGGLTARRLFGRFDYDVSDDVHFFAEAFGAFNSNAYQNQSLSFSNVAVRSQNPFLASAYQYGTGTTTFNISQIPLNVGAHRSVFDVTSGWFNAGFEGQFGNGYKWEVAASHGQSKQVWNTLNNINYAKLSAALDAVTDSSGNIVCNVTLTNPGLYPGCQPLNLFGPTAASAEALDYVTDSTQSTATNKLDSLTASISGSPFSTWAGPIDLALSGEWRQSEFEATSQVSPIEFADCTGLRYNCTSATRLHQVTFAAVSPVSQTVSEVAIEAGVPLLKDVAFARNLNVNLAARYANYDTFGGAWTWKAGLDWEVNDQLRLRATRSRDFRAPNLNDLYAAETIARSNIVDQLTGATLINQAFSTSGNPNLKPEEGDTVTAGFVYKPSWFSGFSLAMDAYDIKITDAITAINGTTTAIQNQCNASGGTAAVCALIVRPNPYTDTSTANNATMFYQLPINAAEIHTSGVDTEANYSTRVFDHPLSARLMVTYQPVLTQITPGIADAKVAGYAYSPVSGTGTTPKWRLTAFLNYSVTPELKITLIQRWRSELKWNSDATVFYAEPNIPSFGWTNLNISWSPKTRLSNTEFYLNVQNLFNGKAPLATNSTANPGVVGAYISTDDFIGRYYMLGTRLKF